MDDDILCTHCSVAEGDEQRGALPSGSEEGGDGERLLSVIVLFDYPFDAQALDEALFGLAVQDWDPIEVVVTLPDCGPDVHRDVEAAVRAQPWPARGGWRIVSVSAPSQRTLSAHLINAGLSHATGRYVAFLHHQDLIYQHTYTRLIGRLEGSDAVAAFGGIRRAHHAGGPRHRPVRTKEAVPTGASRLDHLINGPAAIHRFVADRHRLSRDLLRVHNPASSLATDVFLSRLALHPKADYALAATPVCESRHFPPPSSQGGTDGEGRVCGPGRMLAALRGGDLVLRDAAIPPNLLLAEVLGMLRPR
jgi:hypothetical protein